MSRQFLKSLFTFRKVPVIRIGIAGGISLTYYAINGPLLHVFRDIKVHGWSSILDGRPKKGLISDDPPVISPELQKLIDEVMREVKFINNKSPNNISFMVEPVIEAKSYGASGVSQAFVVLPDYFNVTDYKQLKAVQLNRLLKKVYDFEINNPAEWMTDEGKLLIDSFLLSPEAKKFAIAREIYATDNNNLSMMCLYTFFLIYLFFLMNELLSKRLFEKKVNPFSTGAMVMQMLNLAFITMTFAFMKMMIYKRNITEADVFAVTKGTFKVSELEEKFERSQEHELPPDMYEGGIEYYTKEKQRNQSLRKIMVRRAGFFSYNYRSFTPEGQHKTSMLAPSRDPNEVIQKFKQYRYGIPMSYWQKNDWGINNSFKRDVAKKRRELKAKFQQQQQEKQQSDLQQNPSSEDGEKQETVEVI